VRFTVREPVKAAVLAENGAEVVLAGTVTVAGVVNTPAAEFPTVTVMPPA
jgi:hypothetical protein